MSRKVITLRLGTELADVLKEEADEGSITLTEHVTRLIHRGRESKSLNLPDLSKEITDLKVRFDQTEQKCDRAEKVTLNVKEKLETVADELKNFQDVTEKSLKSIEEDRKDTREKIHLVDNLVHRLEGQIEAMNSIISNFFRGTSESPERELARRTP